METLLALALLQSTQSFTLRLHAPVAEALPLFGPVREAEWAPHWQPTFLHPPGGAQVEGAVFTVSAAHNSGSLWVLTEYDLEAGRISYVTIVPDRVLTEIKIRAVPDGPHACRVRVTYRKSALAAEGNEVVEQMDAAWAVQQPPHWEAAINAVLDKIKR